MHGLVLVRALFVVVLAFAAAQIGPGGGQAVINGAVGALFALAVIAAEMRMRDKPVTDALSPKRYRILDTSAIIDGRIADVVETGFLDGTLVVPQFVLKELQGVADSSDSVKRNRGRRGLDVLHRIQTMSGVEVLISDVDFPAVREVDRKLIELARTLPGKIVTQDFNLNKVAQLRGVQVLNLNALTRALKPVVLPGEVMSVFIIKEGKEFNQGVAYLDDGTMVVVDNARSRIGRNLDIVVTSVLQTTAGRMIFGRHLDLPASSTGRPAAEA